MNGSRDQLAKVVVLIALCGCMLGQPKAACQGLGSSFGQGQDAQPPSKAQPVIPWANKLFLESIDEDRNQMPPAEVVHDFGVVPQGAILVHRFTLTNIYDAPLQITELRRSTESLQAFPPQRVVLPNEKADFVVTLDTSRSSATISETVLVTVGPMFVSTAKLRLIATVRPEVTIAPGLLNFGNVAEGAKAEQTATIDYKGKQKDWKLTGASASTTYTTTITDLGRGKFKVLVKLNEDAPAGFLNDTLELKTNDPTMPSFLVGLRAVILGPIEVSTPKIVFPRMKVGEQASYRVVVRGNGVGAFTIEELADQGNGVSVVTIGAASPVHTIVVNFTPTRPGTYEEEIQLNTSLKSGAKVRLTISAEVDAQ